MILVSRYFSLFLVGVLLTTNLSSRDWTRHIPWYDKMFKPQNQHYAQCELAFLDYTYGKISGDFLKNQKSNLWSAKFDLETFVRRFSELGGESEKLKALDDLRSLAYRDPDYVNNLTDVVNSLLATKQISLENAQKIFKPSLKPKTASFVFSEINQRFTGSVVVHEPAKNTIKRFLKTQDLSPELEKEYFEVMLYSNLSFTDIGTAINNGLRLRNDKRSLEYFSEYLLYIADAKPSIKSEGLKDIFKIYDYDFRYNALEYTSSALLGPHKGFLIRKNRETDFLRRRVGELEELAIKRDKYKSISTAKRKAIQIQAEAEARIFGRLLNGCNGQGGKSIKAAAKKFSKFKFGLSLATVPLYYGYFNKDKLDQESENFDRYWFERLGYEMTMGLIFTAIGNYIFTDTSTSFLSKYAGGYVQFGSADTGNAWLYGKMFGKSGWMSKLQPYYRSDLPETGITPLEAEYEKFVASETFESDLKELQDFVEKKSKVPSTRNWISDQVEEMITYKDWIAKKFNFETYKSEDDNDRITLEDMESEEGRLVLLELLAERMYVNNMGDDPFFQTGSQGGDRWLFYRARNVVWDVKGLISNLAIFQIMCKQPVNGPTSWALILSIVGANELAGWAATGWRRDKINQ